MSPGNQPTGSHAATSPPHHPRLPDRVRHDDLVKYGDTNLLDALRRIPGVTVNGSAGRGGEVRLQGLGNGYTQVLVDGERMPPGFAFDALAPDAVERIEVRRAAFETRF